MDADAEVIVVTMAARMTDLRRARDLSLQDIADRTGFAKSHIWEIEKGRSRNPTITTAVGIARALGVSLDYLTGFSTSEPPLHSEAMRIACEVDAVIRRLAKPEAPMARIAREMRESTDTFTSASPASGIEARSAETQGGSAEGESPTPQGVMPDPADTPAVLNRAGGGGESGGEDV